LPPLKWIAWRLCFEIATNVARLRYFVKKTLQIPATSAKSAGLLQPVESLQLDSNVPPAEFAEEHHGGVIYP
jgi:hypothetical protein